MLKRWNATCAAAFAVHVLACGDGALRGVDFAALGMSARNSHVLYAAGNTLASKDIYRSDDGGDTWKATPGKWLDAFERGKQYNHAVTRLAVSPDDPDLVLIATEWGYVFRTDDGGKSWRQVLQVGQLRDYPARGNGYLKFHPLVPGLVFAKGEVSYEGLNFARSTDSGSSWEDAEAGVADECKSGGGADLAFDAVLPQRMYAALGDRGLAVTDDGGRCWAVRGDGTAKGHIVVASPSQSGHVWLAGKHGVFVTEDAGKSFRKLDDWGPLRSWPHVPDEWTTAQGGRLRTASYVERDGAPLLVFGTYDLHAIGVNARTGELVDLGSPLIRRAGAVNDIIFRPDRPGAMLLAPDTTCKGDGAVFRSDDGGRTWQHTTLASERYGSRGPFGRYVEHVIIVSFFRDVTPDDMERIFQEHRVARVEPYVGPRWKILRFDDGRSVSELLREFDALEETDCVLEDHLLSPRDGR